MKHYKAVLKETDLKAILTEFLFKLNSLPIEVSITLNGPLNDYVNIDETFIPECSGNAYFLDVQLDLPTPHFISIISKH